MKTHLANFVTYFITLTLIVWFISPITGYSGNIPFRLLICGLLTYYRPIWKSIE